MNTLNKALHFLGFQQKGRGNRIDDEIISQIRKWNLHIWRKKSSDYMILGINLLAFIVYLVSAILLLFSHQIMSDSLLPHELQHAGLHCPSLFLWVCSSQTHVHWVSGAIQSSFPLSPPSPLALSLFQLQGLFQSISCSNQVAKVLELQLQFFQWIFRVDIL